MLLITAVKRRRLSSLYADYIIVGGEGECMPLVLIFTVLLKLLALFFISGKFIIAVEPPQVHDQSLRGW